MPQTVQRQREHAPIFAIFTAAIYNIAMIQQTEFTLRPRTRGFHLVTDEIAANLPPLPDAGLVHLFIKHTSAGLSINENADPDVRTDLSAIFDRLVRERESYYVHTLEGDDDMPAHAKSAQPRHMAGHLPLRIPQPRFGPPHRRHPNRIVRPQFRRQAGRWPENCIFPKRITKQGKAMTTATKHKTADRLTAEERHELPDSAFGIPETREFPLVDAEHVRAAEAYFRYAPDNKKAALARRILAKAAAYGVNVQSQVIRSWAEE